MCARPPATIAPELAPGTPVIACAKGIEHGTLPLHDRGRSPESVGTGAAGDPCSPARALPPTLARGLPRGGDARGARTRRPRPALARGARVAPRFGPTRSDDLRGVEIGGAAKNVLAIACGIVVGRGLGASARAAAGHARPCRARPLRRRIGRAARDVDRPVRARRPDPDLHRAHSRATIPSGSRSAKVVPRRPATSWRKASSPRRAREMANEKGIDDAITCRRGRDPSLGRHQRRPRRSRTLDDRAPFRSEG